MFVGLAIGPGVSAALGRYLSAHLIGVTSTDVTTYATVAAVLIVVATVACAIPAWRAARIDALTALRR
jgi:ABC-type lipoprotein release transport system permease subunit